MKPKKRLRKQLTAILAAAVLTCTAFAAKLPGILQREAEETVFAAADDSFSESRLLNDILNGEDESEEEIRSAFRAASDFPEAYTALGYQVLYTKGLESDFIFVYNSSDIDLRAALTTPDGLVWAEHYAKYLTVLSQMTGVQRKNLICVFNTDLDSGYPGANHDTWFHISHDAAFAAAGGILQQRFTHALLHETAHSYHTHFYKMAFDSEEEVYVNLRMLCALHWAGFDTGKMMLTSASSKWTFADASLDPKYVCSDSDLICLQDPAYQPYFPEGSRVYELWDLQTTFLPISVPQQTAFSSYADSSEDRFYSRLAVMLNAVAEKPVFCASQEDPKNRSNWMNTDDIAANWETITEEDWKKLSALCISDPEAVLLPEYGEDITRLYYRYRAQCTEKIRYFYSRTDDGAARKKYAVSVTPRVLQWISETCSAEDGLYYMTGNLIQAFNMCDFMEIDMDAVTLRNQYLNPAPSLRKYYLSALSTSLETRHACILTAEGPAIIVQPADADADVGETVSFTLETTGSGAVYQWEYCNGSDWHSSSSEGADTPTVSKEVLEGRDGQQYRCVVSWPDGTQLISDAATLRIRPAITVHPEDAEAESGDKVTFSVAASGEDLTYAWQYNLGSGWKASNSATAAEADLVVTAATARSGIRFRCVVTGASGAESISDEAVLTVLPKTVL